MQVRLLRFLENGEVRRDEGEAGGRRVIAARIRPLSECVLRGVFREDLSTAGRSLPCE
jgi:DNA-binding NtrC family response regulator